VLFLCFNNQKVFSNMSDPSQPLAGTLHIAVTTQDGDVHHALRRPDGTSQPFDPVFRHTVRAQLAMLSLAASLAAGCSAQSHPAPQPPPATTAGIRGAYTFDTLGTQPFPITVHFSGSLMTARGSEGASSFDVSVDQTISPFGPATVSFTAAGLKPGTWTVIAQPNCCGGPAQCKVDLPGMITLDVSGGMGPNCR
jgi:hypothetical protein